MATSNSYQIGTSELRSAEALRATFAEFIATALFLFFGVGSVAAMLLTAPTFGGGVVIPALAFGLSIGVLAAGAGPISGGHINPAVTFAFILTNRISVVRGAMYIVAQLVGACLGIALLRAFMIDEIFLSIPGAGGNDISEAVPNDLAAVGVEATITFMLVWTIFATAVTPRGSGNLAPLFIGLTVVIIHLVSIPLTGTGANPARTFGPAMIMGRWDDHWVYWAGPLLGAAIASLSYWFLYLQAHESNPHPR